MDLKIRKTRLYDVTMASTAKVLIHEGGAGSSKTWSVLQSLLVRSFTERGRLYTVVRKTGPALTRSARRDFELILAASGALSLFDTNKSEGTYRNRITGTTIEFFAVDDPMKAHGPRRDRLFCNEMNELSHDDTKALFKRTRNQIIGDYNPSFQRSYIYDEILTRSDCQHVLSNYRDNTFLTDGERTEIEQSVPVYEEADGTLVTDWDLTYTGTGTMIRGDAYEWAVYGLGQRGSPGEAVYPHVYEGDFPEDIETALGLDFGYNHAMVLVRVGYRDRDGRRPALHVDELFHEKKVLNAELIERAPSLGVTKAETLWCDSSRPDLIREWQDAGYDARDCEKGPGSVYSQITWVKGHDLIFTPRSTMSRDQCQDYRWKKRNDGTVLDEPAKVNDDAPDAIRYGAFNAFAQDTTPSLGYYSTAA